MAPERGGGPEDAENTPDEIPTFQPLPLSKIRVRPKNQRKANLSVYEPACARSSAEALNLLVRVSLENGQGTHRPGHVLTAVGEGKTRFYLMPVANSDSPDALEVSYSGYHFSINLFKPFGLLERHVRGDFREIYEVDATETPIRIGNLVGKALVIALDKPDREPIQTLTDEEKARRDSRREPR